MYTYVHVLVLWMTLVSFVVGGSGIFSQFYSLKLTSGFRTPVMSCQGIMFYRVADRIVSCKKSKEFLAGRLALFAIAGVR